MKLEVGKKYSYKTKNSSYIHDKDGITITEKYGSYYTGEWVRGTRKEEYIIDSHGYVIGVKGECHYTPCDIQLVEPKSKTVIDYTLISSCGLTTDRFGNEHLFDNNLYLVRTNKDYYSIRTMETEDLRKLLDANK